MFLLMQGIIEAVFGGLCALALVICIVVILWRDAHKQLTPEEVEMRRTSQERQRAADLAYRSAKAAKQRVELDARRQQGDLGHRQQFLRPQTAPRAWLHAPIVAEPASPQSDQ